MPLQNEKEYLAVKRLRAEASARSSTASRGARAAQLNVATVVNISPGFFSQPVLDLDQHSNPMDGNTSRIHGNPHFRN
jgi:hypothetical protein